MNPIERGRWWLARHGYRGDGPAAYAARKPDLFAGLAGRVLELGPGRGRNLRLLPPRVDAWLGLEPNPYLHEPLAAAAAAWSERTHRPADVLAGAAEAIPLAAGSVDAVLSTFVLCSVRDLDRALAEVTRVLRPGGRLVLLEHVAPPRGTWSYRLLRLAAPLSRLTDAGCDPARDTGAGLARAGFAAVDVATFTATMAGLTVPHLAGSATAATAARP